MAIYMKADGIQGDTTAKGYEHQIELHSIHFDAARPVRMNVGNYNQGQSNHPYFGQIHIVKMPCSASPILFSKFINASNIPQVEIACCHTDNQLEPHVVYHLNDVNISQVSLPQDSRSPKGQESYALSYAQIEIRYTPRDKNNQPGTPISSGYNLETAQAM